uniref:Uncharacterized protein n=1 Tax=Lutzomyia longipalpis TaxID=7200 RepID=A0A1B0GKM5_LUTLO
METPSDFRLLTPKSDFNMMSPPNMYGGPFQPYRGQPHSLVSPREDSPPTSVLNLKRYTTNDPPSSPTIPVSAHHHLHHTREQETSMAHQRPLSAQSPQ